MIYLRKQNQCGFISKPLASFTAGTKKRAENRRCGKTASQEDSRRVSNTPRETARRRRSHPRVTLDGSLPSSRCLVSVYTPARFEGVRSFFLPSVHVFFPFFLIRLRSLRGQSRAPAAGPPFGETRGQCSGPNYPANCAVTVDPGFLNSAA